MENRKVDQGWGIRNAGLGWSCWFFKKRISGEASGRKGYLSKNIKVIRESAGGRGIVGITSAKSLSQEPVPECVRTVTAVGRH